MPDETFDDFFRRDFHRLVAFLRKAGFEPEAAADAAAETMTTAFLCWDTLSTPAAWVRKVAFRFAATQDRRQRDGLTRAVTADWVKPECDDSGQHAEIEERPAVVALLAQLPPQRRQVMAWHLEGFGTEEIAGQMSLTAATVRSHLRYARESLKATFRESQADVEDPVQNDVPAEEVPHRGSPG